LRSEQQHRPETAAPEAVGPSEPVFPADLDAFLPRVPVLAEELRSQLARRKRRLDYSPRSLRVIDALILASARSQRDPEDSEAGRLLLQQLVAYYGEVLRRNLAGRWIMSEPHEPAVVFGTPPNELTENLYGSIIQLWTEREPSDRLAVRYPSALDVSLRLPTDPRPASGHSQG
jgi:hypothetical protein